MNKHAFRAAWILPVGSEPIRDGVVEVSDGRVVSLQSAEHYRGPVIDFGKSAIIPALVNAHTHLEFSDLKSPIGEPGIGFADWILEVVDYRIRRKSELGGDSQALINAKQAVIKRGLEESAHSGVAAIGEIVSAPFDVRSYEAFVRSDCKTILFLEHLGRDPSEIEKRVAQIESELERGDSELVRMGVSPHAPYSVHSEMFGKLVSLADERRIPIAMHLAESREELQLMSEIDGPFVPVLEKLGAWFPDSYRAGMRPLDYLHLLATTKRSLVIHGNYLDAEELSFLADRRERMSVVYCPRTHHFFGHDRYPLERMLELGVSVAIGTDSRASNPDLNLLEELRLVARQFPNLDPSLILEMGTIRGAEALGLQSQFGTIAIGGDESLAVVSLDGNFDEPYDFLYGPKANCELLNDAIDAHVRQTDC